MDKTTIRNTVRDHIQREFLRDQGPTSLEDSTPLITGGVLDSISTIRLVSFLEEHFKVEFQAHEVAPDYLDTLAAIADTVAGKLQAK